MTRAHGSHTGEHGTEHSPRRDRRRPRPAALPRGLGTRRRGYGSVGDQNNGPRTCCAAPCTSSGVPTWNRFIRAGGCGPSRTSLPRFSVSSPRTGLRHSPGPCSRASRSRPTTSGPTAIPTPKSGRGSSRSGPSGWSAASPSAATNRPRSSRSRGPRRLRGSACSSSPGWPRSSWPTWIRPGVRARCDGSGWPGSPSGSGLSTPAPGTGPGATSR